MTFTVSQAAPSNLIYNNIVPFTTNSEMFIMKKHIDFLPPGPGQALYFRDPFYSFRSYILSGLLKTLISEASGHCQQNCISLRASAEYCIIIQYGLAFSLPLFLWPPQGPAWDHLKECPFFNKLMGDLSPNIKIEFKAWATWTVERTQTTLICWVQFIHRDVEAWDAAGLDSVLRLD